MKKSLLWAFTLPVFLVLFSACGKDDDSPDSFDVYISNVANSYSGTSEVRAVAAGLNHELASCTAGSSMTLKLPGKVASRYLTSIGDDYPEELFEVSDRSAAWTGMVDFYGYTSGGVRTGAFLKGRSLDETSVQFARYCYVDKPVTIEAEFDATDNDDNEIQWVFDYTLTRGWNILSQKQYYREDETIPYKVENLSGFVGTGYWRFDEE